MIGIVAGDPARFGVEENKLRMVTRMLQTIEGTVLDGQIFEVMEARRGRARALACVRRP